MCCGIVCGSFPCCCAGDSLSSLVWALLTPTQYFASHSADHPLVPCGGDRAASSDSTTDVFSLHTCTQASAGYRVVGLRYAGFVLSAAELRAACSMFRTYGWSFPHTQYTEVSGCC